MYNHDKIESIIETCGQEYLRMLLFISDIDDTDNTARNTIAELRGFSAGRAYGKLAEEADKDARQASEANKALPPYPAAHDETVPYVATISAATNGNGHTEPTAPSAATTPTPTAIVQVEPQAASPTSTQSPPDVEATVEAEKTVPMSVPVPESETADTPADVPAS